MRAHSDCYESNGVSVVMFFLLFPFFKGGPFTFYFMVKLYPLHPSYLFEEVTRYFLTLQLRKDVTEGV